MFLDKETEFQSLVTRNAVSNQLPVTTSSKLELQEKVVVQSHTHEQENINAQNKCPQGQRKEGQRTVRTLMKILPSYLKMN